MDRSKHPLEKLRTERELRGWSQRKVATEIGTSEKRVSAWELGESAPGPHFREKLCLLFGKNTLELGLQGKRAPISPSLREDHTGCFAFGTLQTTWMVIDGDGVESYRPQHIRSRYDPSPDAVLEEIAQTKEKIQQEQESNKEVGRSVQWNGEKYNLTNFVVSREASDECMTLLLWFKPTDYYTLLAKNTCLEDATFRNKYLKECEWDAPIPYLPSSFGISLTIITSDGYTLFTQRSASQGIRPGMFNTSVTEGISRPLDRGTANNAPDMYRAASRGLAEELGLHERSDFSVSDIRLLSFGVDTQYMLWGLRGVIKLKKSIDEIVKNWHAGVKDKIENKHIFPIKFTPQDVQKFVFSHENWTPGGLICVYHALIHEFGREEVESALARID